MIQRILRRGARGPLPCIAAILFVAVLTVILCFLHRSQTEEQQHLKNTYDSTPVEFEITWLDGTRLNDSKPASGHMADILPELFLGTSRHEPQFDDLVTDLQIRMSSVGTELREEEAEAVQEIVWDMVGITSPEAAKDQPSQFGELIQWNEGFDESILRTDRMVCIVPAHYDGPEEEIVLTFMYSSKDKYTCTFQIVGRFTDESIYNIRMYCPYAAMEYIYARINKPKAVDCLSGRLADNDELEIFKERAAEWFATPNTLGDPTPWGRMGYDHYPLAIDIDDSLLEGLETDLQNSITINRIAAGLVFVFSAGAGFLTGFLMIRSRKREIGLMRTLGTSNGMVCAELGLEQILCVAIGVILGGSYSLWQPVGQLCIFAGVYIVGLAVALLLFVRVNLLATMKEDE